MRYESNPELTKKFKDVFDKINNDANYDFLINDSRIKSTMMYATLGGSLGYGTDNENSDIDLRGILFPLKRELLGFTEFEQFEDKVTDTVLYEFRKFVNLASKANPNVIELLGTRPEQIYHISKEGILLRDNINLFLTQNVAHSFSGYANNQLRRLQNSVARDRSDKNQKEIHICKSIQNQLIHFENHYESVINSGSLNVYVGPSNKADFDQEIFVNINLQNYPLRDLKNIFSEMTNVVKDYEKSGQRNNKKTVEGLNKHAMHLVRLYKMGIEILSGKGVITYREHDRDELLEIRNGKYQNEDETYKPEFFEFVDQLEKEFDYAKSYTSLPVKPDYKIIEELVIEINENVLKG